MTIILFNGNRSKEAIAAIMSGHQVLELWDKSYTMGPDVPACFRGKNFAKLYDNDELRLIATARRLGVRIVVVDREGQPGRQHVDLVGKPMQRAIDQATPAEQLLFLKDDDERETRPESSV